MAACRVTRRAPQQSLPLASAALLRPMLLASWFLLAPLGVATAVGAAGIATAEAPQDAARVAKRPAAASANAEADLGVGGIAGGEALHAKVATAFEAPRRLQKVRELERGTKLATTVFFFTFMLLMLVMYIFQIKTMHKAQLLEAGMYNMVSADRYLLKILQNFSSKAMEAHIFHGIRPMRTKIQIRFENLGASINVRTGLPCFGGKKEQKVVMEGISGTFEAGKIAAIMGTSGAGKTTFLNALTGKIGALGDWEMTGNVYVNGEAVQLPQLKNIMGFVPQDDVVHDIMTVRENIEFSAMLRNEAGTSTRRLRRITDDVLQVLQLEAQQNIRVGNRTTGGGLSGGQRKRVNVGLELAACPNLLFLDEPTSGLDATGSLLLVRQLNKMAQLGMTIVMVIHQPRYSLFTHIDDVLLLGKGGRVAYVGPTEGAKGYFEELGFKMPENENPADWMMDVMAGKAEIDNPRIPREALPERLFKEWDEYGRTLDFSLRRLERSPSRYNVESDEAIIKAHLQDAWRLVYGPDTQALDPDAFSKVLMAITGVAPDERVLAELVQRIDIAAVNSKFQDVHVRGHVTQKEFERYLMAVNAGGISLASMETVSVFPSEGCETESEDGDSDTGSDRGRARTLSDHDDDTGRLSSEGRKLQRSFSCGIERTLPSFCQQLPILARRRMIQWWRCQPLRIMFLVVVEVAAFFLGVMDRYVFKNSAWLPTGIYNAQISVALLVSVYCINTFASVDELPIVWRETSHGLNRLAFFLSRAIFDILDIVIFCVSFVMMYYIVTAPALDFKMYMIPFLLVSYVASGWGYFVSCWLPFEFVPLGAFVTTLLCFVFGGILGLPNEMGMYLSSPWIEIPVSILSFTRWGTPMVFFAYIRNTDVGAAYMNMEERYLYQYAIQDYRQGWHLPGDDNYFLTGTLALVVLGTLLRVLAYIGLNSMNKAKQV